jgi:hypothetical protein
MKFRDRYRRLSAWNKWTFWGVLATFLSLGLSVVWRAADIREASSPDVPVFHGRVSDDHYPTGDESKLIDFLLAYDGGTVQLDLVVGVGQEIRENYEESADGLRHYSIALAALREPLLMDLLVAGKATDDLFVAGRSNTTDVLRGTFKVKGCVSTGPGWFACQLVALPLRAST